MEIANRTAAAAAAARLHRANSQRFAGKQISNATPGIIPGCTRMKNNTKHPRPLQPSPGRSWLILKIHRKFSKKKDLGKVSCASRKKFTPIKRSSNVTRCLIRAQRA